MNKKQEASTISDEKINLLIDLFEKHYGITLSQREAYEIGLQIINLIKCTYAIPTITID